MNDVHSTKTAKDFPHHHFVLYSIGPDKSIESTGIEVSFRPIPLIWCPLYGAIVSAITLHNQHKWLKNADQSAKPANGTMHGYIEYLSVAVYVLAVAIKWNVPSVTGWAVF